MKGTKEVELGGRTGSEKNHMSAWCLVFNKSSCVSWGHQLGRA
jgi:hypothetical protein